MIQSLFTLSANSRRFYLPIFLAWTFLAGLPLSAQRYEQLWQQVEAAARKDLPATSLTHLDAIRQKATAEHNAAQLLRASLLTAIHRYDISPDSLKPWTEAMEQMGHDEQRPTEHALWQAALALHQAAVARACGWPADTATLGMAKRRMKAVLAADSLLASARYTDYLPLFTKGAQSSWYADDLLHVVYGAACSHDLLTPDEQRAFLGRYIALYRRMHRREAALLCTLDSIRASLTSFRVSGRVDHTHIYKEYVRLLTAYADSPLLHRVYEALTRLQPLYEADSPLAAHNDSLLLASAREGIAVCRDKEATAALRRFVSSMEQPAAQLLQLPTTAFPGQSVSLSVRTRHLRQLTLRLTPLFPSQLSYLQFVAALNGDEQKALHRLAGKARKQAVGVPVALPDTAAWLWSEQTVSLTLPQPAGVYFVQLWAEGKAVDGAVVSVSSVRPMLFSLANGLQRLSLVDGRTGLALPHAKVTAYDRDARGKLHRQAVYETDAEGLLFLTADKATTGRIYLPEAAVSSSPGGISAATAIDAAAPSFTLDYYRTYGYHPRTVSYTEAKLFTDRAIYRPGQTVQFCGVVYSRSADDFACTAGLTATVELLDANRKVIATLRPTADDYGSFSGSFVLPKPCLKGQFTLRALVAGSQTQMSFRVEDYQRPFFRVETQPLSVAYSLGDTVQVQGRALTYSGLPVAGGRVTFRVSRTSWWRWGGVADMQQGEAVTDADGAFCLPVVLGRTDTDAFRPSVSRYVYQMSYTVTAPSGETVEGTHSLPLYDEGERLSLEAPALICREALPAFCARRLNASEQELSSAATWHLFRAPLSGRSGAVATLSSEVARDTLTTGRPFRLPVLAGLPSGRYVLTVATADGALSDTATIALFSLSDHRPPSAERPLFVYHAPSEVADGVLLVGTPETDAVLYYDLLVGDRLVESRRMTLSDSLVRFSLPYRESYGEGAHAYFALMRQGTLHVDDFRIERPAPQKSLCLRWTSFRSRLVPGSDEEWKLSVRRPDGRPVAAAVMARMYDASLDAFTQRPWQLDHLRFYRYLPSASWQDGSYAYHGFASLYWAQPLPFIRETEWQMASFDDALFALSDRMASTYYAKGGGRFRLTSNEAAPTAVKTRAADLTVPLAPASKRAALAATDHLDAASSEEADAGAGASTADDDGGALRTDFAETAFFLPRLRTDSVGEVSLAFRLPETVTAWHIDALAFTCQMDYGRTDTMAVARKAFMAEVSLPPFARRGDCLVLPVRLTNLTAGRQRGEVTLCLSDALSSRTLRRLQLPFDLPPDSALTLSFRPEALTFESDLLVCRVMASTPSFADGEERYLPLLSDAEVVTRSLPLTLTEAGLTRHRLDTLFRGAQGSQRSLTIETVARPIWSAISALPSLHHYTGGRRADDYAVRFYTLALSQHLARRYPAIRQAAEALPDEQAAMVALRRAEGATLTPWLRQLEGEASRTTDLRLLFDTDLAAAHRATALEGLKALQRSDGGFSWYRSMPSSPYITARVALLLCRAAALAGDHGADALCSKAMAYLDHYAAERVAEMKRTSGAKAAPQVPDASLTTYLYARALAGLPATAATRYLTDLALSHASSLPLDRKAMLAATLSLTGCRREAAVLAESLLQHTVASPSLGRYFDATQAPLTSQSYRLPSHCATMEALALTGHAAPCREMAQWLVQAKRTQLWGNAQVSAEAVYALLSYDDNEPALAADTTTASLHVSLYRRDRSPAVAKPDTSLLPRTVGYSRLTLTGDKALCREMRIDKRDEGLSFVSVHASCSAPILAIGSEGQGLGLTRRVEVMREGRWLTVDTAMQPALRLGDRLRMVYTLRAERDYDFVHLESARPACLRPVESLSRYACFGLLSVYCAAADATTDFYIEHLPKGSHTLTEEFFVTRSGTYLSGLARLTCVYADEFRALAPVFSLRVP